MAKQKKEEFVVEGISKLGLKKVIPIIVIVLIAAIVAFSARNIGKDAVQEGDKITLEYTIKLENGSVFEKDTKAVTLGGPSLPKALSDQIIGMRVGEEKTVVLGPEQAYGAYSKDLVKLIKAVESLPRTDNISLNNAEAFLKRKLKVGEEVRIEGIQWPVEVLEINRNNNTATVENKPVLGSIYFDPLTMRWPIKVIGITETEIVYENKPKVGGIYQDGELTGTVIKIDNGYVYLDFNHPLAGESLTYEIKLVDIEGLVAAS